MCISDEQWHKFAIKHGLIPKTNLDIINDEINNKNNLIKQHTCNYRNGRNYVDVYFFSKPVNMVFTINSNSIDYYSLFKTYNNIEILSVLIVGNDIECIMQHNGKTESVYIFDEVHEVNFKIIE